MWAHCSGCSPYPAIPLWFWFKIPGVIANLSGRTARTAIEKIRKNNEKTGGQGYQPSPVNANRGKITDMITPAPAVRDKPVKLTATEPPEPKPPAPAMRKPGDGDIPETGKSMPETGLLADNKEHYVSSMETQPLGEEDETELLADENETALLVEERPILPAAGSKELVLLEEIMLIHTKEVIA